jgi:aminoglycoside 2'-N-acetyltransferase I
MTDGSHRLEVAHTAELDPATLGRARALMRDVFGDAMTDADWDHALGGVHSIVWEGPELVAHASVVQRQLLHAGRAWRTGYVEGVAVRTDRQRRGYGAAVMAPVEDVIRRAYELGALGASEAGVPFYRARNWRPWRGPTAALTPEGVVRTPSDDGDIYVLEVSPGLDLDADLTCDYREGDLW